MAQSKLDAAQSECSSSSSSNDLSPQVRSAILSELHSPINSREFVRKGEDYCKTLEAYQDVDMAELYQELQGLLKFCRSNLKNLRAKKREEVREKIREIEQFKVEVLKESAESRPLSYEAVIQAFVSSNGLNIIDSAFAFGAGAIATNLIRHDTHIEFPIPEECKKRGQMILETPDLFYESKPWGSIPLKNPNFVGRESILKEMRACFTEKARAFVINPGKDVKGEVSGLTGLGGIGKTELAKAFLYGLIEQEVANIDVNPQEHPYALIVWLDKYRPKASFSPSRRCARLKGSDFT